MEWTEQIKGAMLDVVAPVGMKAERLLKAESVGKLPASSYLVVGDAEEVGTWHLPVRNADGTPNPRLMGAAWAALTVGHRGKKYAGPDKSKAKAKLRRMYTEELEREPPGEKGLDFAMTFKGAFVGTVSPMRPYATKDLEGEFMVFKDGASGEYRWLSVSSTAYEDREGEVVSRKALEKSAALMQATREYGPLRWWHVGDVAQGLNIGVCDFSAVHGKSLVESGTFKADWIGAALARAKGVKVSLGFTHPPGEPDSGGTFNNIRVFERSVLPEAYSSNPFTNFGVVGVEKEVRAMATLKEKVEKFLGLFSADDQENVKQFVQDIELTEKAADEAGVRHKESDGLGDFASFVTGVDGTVTKAEKKPSRAEMYESLMGAYEKKMYGGMDEAEKMRWDELSEEKRRAGLKKLLSEDEAMMADYSKKMYGMMDEEQQKAYNGMDDEKKLDYMRKLLGRRKKEAAPEPETKGPDARLVDLSVEQFAGALSGALAVTMDPFLTEVKELSGRVDGLVVAVKESSGVPEYQATVTEAIEGINGQLQSFQEELATSRAALKEVTSDVPRALQVFNPATDSSTVLAGITRTVLKEAGIGPNAQPEGPMADFGSWVMGAKS